MTTGFFGIPGRRPTNDSHHVHLVQDGKCVCGTHQHREAQYQWCGPGIIFDYIECLKCKVIARRLAVSKGLAA